MELNQKWKKRIEESLKETQKNCSVRLIEVRDIEYTIGQFEDLLNAFKGRELDIIYYTGDYKKGYTYEGTNTLVSFNNKGTIVAFNSSRTKNCEEATYLCVKGEYTIFEEKLLKLLGYRITQRYKNEFRIKL